MGALSGRQQLSLCGLSASYIPNGRKATRGGQGQNAFCTRTSLPLALLRCVRLSSHSHVFTTQKLATSLPLRSKTRYRTPCPDAAPFVRGCKVEEFDFERSANYKPAIRRLITLLQDLWLIRVPDFCVFRPHTDDSD
jgi:hypothetical protein